ncbi:MAG: arginyltransferase [Polyangiaceae bacterium]|nr:arginyltransferase [Polyangiaceae bacterium]
MSTKQRQPCVPSELVVYDKLSRCPYLHGRIARMPLRLPARVLTRGEFDQRLRGGDRRQGIVLYRTMCPACHACEPIRLVADRTVLSRAQRRVWRTTGRVVQVERGKPVVDPQRVALYNRHKNERGLGDGHDPLDVVGYAEFLGSTCCETFELRYLVAGQTVGVAIVDRGADALSAVYCYYDPDYAKLSLGTYSILVQLSLCREWGLRYLYLGLYVKESARMRYKGNFRPHERLVGGQWQGFISEDEPVPQQ